MRYPGMFLAGSGLVAMLLGCATGPVSNSRMGAHPTEAATREVAVSVAEKNLVLPGEAEARAYLRDKLTALLTIKLTEMGLPPALARAAANRGEFEDEAVSGRAARVHGQGDQEGRIIETVLFEVRGRLILHLDDGNVAAMAGHLAMARPGNLDGLAGLRKQLALLAGLGPRSEDLKKAQEHLAGVWADLIRRAAEQWQPAPSPDLSVIKPVGQQLTDYLAAYPEQRSRSELEDSVSRGLIRLVQMIPVDESHAEHWQGLLKQVDWVFGRCAPAVVESLRRHLELTWSARMEDMAGKQAPLDLMRLELVAFDRFFPGSNRKAALEQVLASRWAAVLLAARPGGLEQLQQMTTEWEGFSSRFPGHPESDRIMAEMGRHCLRILPGVTIRDMPTLERVQAILAVCRAGLPDNPRRQALLSRVEQLDKRLRSVHDERRDRQELAELAFLLDWERDIHSVNWHGSRNDWQGEGSFALKWREAARPDEDCVCSLDSGDPCRLLSQKDIAGQVELVGRFHEGRLLGVDYCRLPIGDHYSRLVSVLGRRHHALPIESPAQASGRVRRARFGVGKRLQLDLECGAQLCDLRFRDRVAYADWQRVEASRLKRSQEEASRKRQSRIQRGWRAGDCVRWECNAIQQCRGTVADREGLRYRVSVLECPDDPRRCGNQIDLQADVLFDCPAVRPDAGEARKSSDR